MKYQGSSLEILSKRKQHGGYNGSNRTKHFFFSLGRGVVSTGNDSCSNGYNFDKETVFAIPFFFS